MARGQNLARELGNLPGNVATPTYLAETAERIAREHGMKVTVLGREELRAEGLQALLAVAQGSEQEPLHRPGAPRRRRGAKPLVLVGKGLTFDAGGISIKPAQGMEEMKFDMCGGAAVLGAMQAIGELKVKANVVGIVPASENLLSGAAMKPGDVIRSHLGKTIEVINTDAEGRLILADALSYARRFEPAAVLDAATLTGACVIALGHRRQRGDGQRRGADRRAPRAGDRRTGERVWPLPMYDEYREQLKSDYADIKNSGGRPAGTITAGWFLREFVGDFPWAHLDIAGTAWGDGKLFVEWVPEGHQGRDRAPCPGLPGLFVEWVFEVRIPPEAVSAQADTPVVALPDTAARDTVAAPPGPAPNFPVFPDWGEAGFATAVWVWGPEELARFHGLTLVDILERVPGLVITREGSFGRPVGVSAFAAGGGRLRVFVDGWELPALAAGTFDPQRIPLVDVEAVRVVRTMAETRLEIRTFRLPDERPYALVEGADGDFGTRVLRGMFMRPLGARGMIHVGLDLAESDGFQRRERFAGNTLFARLGYAFSTDAGIRADVRRTGYTARSDRAGVPFPAEETDRVETLLRGRARVAGPLWVDAAFGASRVEPLEQDTVSVAARATQGMLRAVLALPYGSLGGGVRLFRAGGQGGFAADGTELSARAELSPSPSLTAWGEARATRWAGVSGAELEGGARLGLAGGLSVFGSVAAGRRGVLFQNDTIAVLRAMADPGNPEATVEVLVSTFPAQPSTLGGLRAGADWNTRGIRAGAAYVLHDAETLVPYGLGFDRGLEPYPGGRVGGVEAHLSVPLLVPQLRLEGWYADFFATPARPYLPARLGRGALEYHGVFREGNLEPTIRLEAVGRGTVRAFDPVTFEEAETQAYVLFNFYLQIRILDVRAFYRFDNLLNQRPADVPGLALPGGRGMFGVRWFFQD
jgi:hypothetical protein